MIRNSIDRLKLEIQGTNFEFWDRLYLYMSWEVVIAGDKSDLEELSKVLTDKDLSIVKKKEHFVLRSEYLDVLSNNDEVNEKVIEILNSVNAGANLILDSRKTIKPNDIFQLDEKGNTVKIFIISKLGTFGKASISKISHSDGKFEIYNQAMPARNWIRMAQEDHFVKKVFTQINYGFDSWVALYNILEILQQAQFEPVGKNGAYRDKVDDITQKANSYEAILEESRHPGKSIPPPENQIELLEAKSFVKMVLLQWLAQKEQEWLNQKES